MEEESKGDARPAHRRRPWDRPLAQGGGAEPRHARDRPPEARAGRAGRRSEGAHPGRGVACPGGVPSARGLRPRLCRGSARARSLDDPSWGVPRRLGGKCPCRSGGAVRHVSQASRTPRSTRNDARAGADCEHSHRRGSARLEGHDASSANPEVAQAEANVQRSRARFDESLGALENKLARRGDWRAWIRSRPATVLTAAFAIGLLWGLRHDSKSSQGANTRRS